MTPSYSSGKRGGNLVVQRVFKGGVGEIRKALGTKSARVYKQRVALLEKLARLEQWELLRLFRDDKITIEQLVEADNRGELRQGVDAVKLSRNLWDAIEETLPKMGKGAATRARYARSLRAFQRKSGLSDSARVQDLASVDWKGLSTAWGESGTDWMHMRRAVSAFLSQYFDLYHPFRRGVMKSLVTRPEKKRQPNVRIADFRQVVAKAPDQLRASFWTIALTGMRLGEYMACGRANLDASTCSISIPGTKNEQSAAVVDVDPRLWHYIVAGVPCPVKTEKWLRVQWNRAVAAAGYGSIHLHDLRHCHGQWAIDAGVAESKVQASLRHKSAGQTRDYVLRNATREVSSALADQIEKESKPARSA